MDVTIMGIEGKPQGKKALPAQFSETVRPDLIKRAVLALQSRQRQPYGASPEAGKRASAELSRRRHDYRGAYGFGISRVPRKIHSRRGTRMYWVGAVAPGTVGGRRAHPPKAEKRWEQKMNKKENKLAVRSALAATMSQEWVERRGHTVPKDFPFILDDKLEGISKTKQVRDALAACGLELGGKRTIRAGKGKLRGRKYKIQRGVLIVTSEGCPLAKSAANLQGVEVATIDSLNAGLLAPGCHPGRLTLYTAASINKLEKDRLFA
jgi:large subunit ribosomal protein L4e